MNSQFALFRIFFGAFLTWHFIALIPYGSELFSNEGIISDPALNPTYGIFPNHLYFWDTPMAVTLTLGIAILASVSFTHRTLGTLVNARRRRSLASTSALVIIVHVFLTPLA